MKNVILQFESVSITCANGFCAVRDMSFEVGTGETLAIVAESGSEKTTLAKAALGILPKNAKISGSIKINDAEIVGANEKTLRKIRGLVAGFVAQEPFSAFNQLFSVFDHVAEASRVHKLTPEKAAICNLLENFGIENTVQKAEKYPFEWSGGMLQRAAIAAAAHKPKLIIADEPTSALDATTAQTVMKLFRKIAERGTAIIIVNHNEPLLRSFCHRILRMSEGILSGDDYYSSSS